MSEILTFRLENRTKFSSDFRHSGCSVRSIVQLYYKRWKSDRSVGRVNQPNVWNPNKMVQISDTVWNQMFGNGTTLETAKIQTFGFQTLTVIIFSWLFLKAANLKIKIFVCFVFLRPQPKHSTVFTTQSAPERWMIFFLPCLSNSRWSTMTR